MNLGDIGMSSAAGVYQSSWIYSCHGCNHITKRYSEDNGCLWDDRPKKVIIKFKSCNVIMFIISLMTILPFVAHYCFIYKNTDITHGYSFFPKIESRCLFL